MTLSRYCYEDEQHLDEALKRIFQSVLLSVISLLMSVNMFIWFTVDVWHAKCSSFTKICEECYDKYVRKCLEKAAEARRHSFWGRPPDNAGSYNSQSQDTEFFCGGGDYRSVNVPWQIWPLKVLRFLNGIHG